LEGGRTLKRGGFFSAGLCFRSLLLWQVPDRVFGEEGSLHKHFGVGSGRETYSAGITRGAAVSMCWRERGGSDSFEDYHLHCWGFQDRQMGIATWDCLWGLTEGGPL